ncbi:hypothetical protein Nepgr_016154 [Nepenthes gracilis]|uniref:Uncharacterized protein n=1 Tax=Nepenthes gracilis TaxID=150966 RepID=A0AAD3SM69_NEPGR|nr:hypothetical protein Nepgr_016154 [Nepenthes gracilis]
MADTEKQLLEQITHAGNRLLQPPSSTDELLSLLDEVELLLAKVGQSAPPLVQEALLPAMKALVSDQLLRNSNMDVKIAVASCLNEVMRITAPDAPYNDMKMKEIFEIIVASFDKLSLVSGRCYNKAVSIIDNVAKIRSCVMMLDLECDALIIQMFEQFLKNIRPNHPHAVFLAMETIMTVIIDESEDISWELLKVLLSSVRKEHEVASPMSWKLGVKVIENTAQKLRPYLVAVIKSMDINNDDYGPIIGSVCQHQSDDVEQNHVDDSGELVVSEEPATNAMFSGEVDQSGVGSKPGLSPQTKKTEYDAAVNKKRSKALECSEQIEKPQQADLRAAAEQEIDLGKVPNKRSRKPNSRNPDEGYDKPSISKGREQSLASPRGLLGKASAVLDSAAETTSARGDLVPKTEVNDVKENQAHQAVSFRSNDSNKKKVKRRDVSDGSGEKRLPVKSKRNLSKRDEDQLDEASNKVAHRKRNLVTDEVFETPHGRKYYKEDLIGCRVKVWWPKDKTYYEGRVAAFDPVKMKHRIEYDDGDTEVLNLRKEIWEMIGDETLSDNGEGDGHQDAHPSSNLSRPKGRLETSRGSSSSREGGIRHSGAKSDNQKLQGAGDSRGGGRAKSVVPEFKRETKRQRLVKGQ